MNPESILIIEDEPCIAELCKNIIFHYLSVKSEIAFDGLAGIEMFDPERHTVVITNIVMPKMNGIEVVEHIREISPVTPIIVESGHGLCNFDNRLKLYRLGVLFCLDKPWNPAVFFRLVKWALQLRRENYLNG